MAASWFCGTVFPPVLQRHESPGETTLWLCHVLWCALATEPLILGKPRVNIQKDAENPCFFQTFMIYKWWVFHIYVSPRVSYFSGKAMSKMLDVWRHHDIFTARLELNQSAKGFLPQHGSLATMGIRSKSNSRKEDSTEAETLWDSNSKELGWRRNQSMVFPMNWTMGKPCHIHIWIQTELEIRFQAICSRPWHVGQVGTSPSFVTIDGGVLLVCYFIRGKLRPSKVGNFYWWSPIRSGTPLLNMGTSTGTPQKLRVETLVSHICSPEKMGVTWNFWSPYPVLNPLVWEAPPGATRLGSSWTIDRRSQGGSSSDNQRDDFKLLQLVRAVWYQSGISYITI